MPAATDRTQAIKQENAAEKSAAAPTDSFARSSVSERGFGDDIMKVVLGEGVNASTGAKVAAGVLKAAGLAGGIALGGLLGGTLVAQTLLGGIGALAIPVAVGSLADMFQHIS